MVGSQQSLHEQQEGVHLTQLRDVGQICCLVLACHRGSWVHEKLQLGIGHWQQSTERSIQGSFGMPGSQSLRHQAYL